jgi:hypothetical protein
MESPTECIRRWQCHVTVRLSQFESLGHSVSKIIWKNSTSPYHCIFPNKLYRPSAIRSVYTNGNILSVYTDRISDGVMPSVYTDRFWDGIISVDKNYRRKNSVGNSIGFRRFSGSGTCAKRRSNPTSFKVWNNALVIKIKLSWICVMNSTIE